MAKKIKREIKPYGIMVDHDSYSHDTRCRDETDSWDRGDTVTSHSVNGIRLAGKNDRWATIQLAWKPVVGKNYWLLYYIYSTGDSFGHDENRCINFVDLYKTVEEAEAGAKAIREFERTYDYRKMCVLKDSSGKTMELYPNWNGYFESLSLVDIDRFTLKPAK